MADTEGYGWKAATDLYDRLGVDYTVTSTDRPRPPDQGRHSTLCVDGVHGCAVDAVGDLPEIAQALMEILPCTYEGIWRGEGRGMLSIKNGQVVDPSFWGAETWKAHGGDNEHLHFSTYIGPDEGPGIPPAPDPQPQPQRKELRMALVLAWEDDGGLHGIENGKETKWGLRPKTCDRLIGAGAPVINDFGENGDDYTGGLNISRGLAGESEETPVWLPYSDEDKAMIAKAIEDAKARA